MNVKRGENGGLSELPSRVAAVTHHRWMIPVLAECARAMRDGQGGGRKYVTFLVRLGVSRDALGRTLEAGIAAGWLTHHAGPGHALRPEYVLSAAGRDIAPLAERVGRSLGRMGLGEVGLKKWSLPTLCALAGEPGQSQRFAELARTLPAATGRALSIALKELEEAGLIVRDVQATHPPAVRYGATARGRRLGKLARAMGEAVGEPDGERSPADGRQALRKSA